MRRGNKLRLKGLPNYVRKDGFSAPTASSFPWPYSRILRHVSGHLLAPHDFSMVTYGRSGCLDYIIA